MRGLVVAVIIAIACSPFSSSAQTAGQGAGKASPRSAVPRGPDGKPDLTGVWQGGSTIRGSWDEANGGLGVGGQRADDPLIE